MAVRVCDAGLLGVHRFVLHVAHSSFCGNVKLRFVVGREHNVILVPDLGSCLERLTRAVDVA